MSIEVLSAAGWRDDTPWRRLYWTLPAALTICIVTLWAFALFIGEPKERLPEPPPIEAQMIELPAPASTVTRPPEKKITAPLPVKPVIPRKVQPTPLPVPPKAVVENRPPPRPQLNPPVEKPAEEPVTTPAVAVPRPPPPPPVQQQPPATNSNLTGISGARAIARPMPQIPDELREEALTASALARFHVAADGSVTVELVKPTPNPRLNRLLLDTLKNWRFFPAMKEGKPVASTQEIVIKVEVK